MKTILCEKIPRIIKNKKLLEKTLNLKLTNRGKELTIAGDAQDEYIGEKVIDAINFGFPLSHALSIKQLDNLFEIVNIKDHTNRHDMATIRGRIIGTKGKTLSTLTNLTNSYIEIKDNKVGIIAPGDTIESTQDAIISIIKGSKQSNVYAHLEKTRPKPIEDLGLRE